MVLDTINIGERIKNIRKKNNLSQEKFAELINSSTQTVSNIETGKVVPNIYTLIKIAYKCECSIDFILGIGE